MAVTLPELPFALAALEPYISGRTFEFHHGRHHKAYVDNTNKLVAGTDLAGRDLVGILMAAAVDPEKKGLFNNAAQAWNHSFFWQCLKAGGGGKPTGKIAGLIEKDLAGFENFVAEFKNAGVTQFGSGWVWLVLREGRLVIQTTDNAETPLSRGDKPLLVADVWEHAYYLDYQNRRPDFLQAFVYHLINWDFVNANLG